MSQSKAQSTGWVVFALLLVQFLFGINYVISKVIVGVFPPLVWAATRLSISTVFILMIALAARRTRPVLNFEFFKSILGLALLGTVINQSAFLVGLKHTSSTNSAILNTLIPIFTLLIVTVRKQEALSIRRVVGFASALLGVLVIRKFENFQISDQSVVGDLLTMLNCLSYALFLSFGKNFMGKHDSIWITFWLFFTGSIGLTVLAVPDLVQFQMPIMTPTLWAAAIFAIFGATLGTYFLNIWALKHAKSTQVALFAYLQPIVAASFAWVVYSDVPTLRTWVASGLIFVGMLLGMKARGEQKE